MRKIADLNHAEIIALTEADIQKMVDMACAEEGLPFVDMPNPIGAKQFVHDTSVFKVGDFTFRTREVAEKVIEFLRQYAQQMVKLEYDYAVGYNEHFITETPSATITFLVDEQPVFTEKLFKQQAEEMKLVKSRKEEYDKQKSEFEKVQKKRTEIGDPIRAVVFLHRSQEREYQNYLAALKKYVELADGDKDVAKRFFEKAYPQIQSDIMARLYRECQITLVSRGRLVPAASAA